MTALRIAFKEWAVICRALAEAKQILILRKGGIHEVSGTFRVEHERFWLYPTRVHQQESGIVESFRPLLARAVIESPPEGTIHLEHIATVERIWRITKIEQALALAGLHGWSAETVKGRFDYREPGLWVLAVRITEAKMAEIVETPYYAGCKSWVELEKELPIEEERPIVSDELFGKMLDRVATTLG
jgi:hypothetical protein